MASGISSSSCSSNIQLSHKRLPQSPIFNRNSSHNFISGLKIHQKQLSISSNNSIRVSRNARRSNNIVCEASSDTAYDASVLESGTYTTEEDLILKMKSEEIEPCLSGRCIYLVGMMGSGKTTIGQILSEVLGYSFFDSDKLIEQAAGGTAVADIFKLHGETFFRDNETEVLYKLSSMRRLVISTGGGAVIRPVNWKYMHKGVSVFIDVPLDALAQRITAIGTASRPLLHHGSGDAYTQTLNRLSKLWEERSEAYINAHVRVSLEGIASKLGHEDVCCINPTQIAIETLIQIEDYLKKQSDHFGLCT